MDDKKLFTIIEKHVLANAIEFGNAKLDSVMKRILSEYPSLRKQAKEIVGEVRTLIPRVNKMSLNDRLAKAQEKYPEILQEKEKKVEEKRELPPLSEARVGQVCTRLPPEPSGYLHIGHGYSFFINWYYSRRYKGKVILRFEDTNPRKVKREYYDVIKEDLEWIGIDWDEEIRESDRIPQYYEYADKLIEKDVVYVCTCRTENVRKLRHEGQVCSHRSQDSTTVYELWEKMLSGEYEEGDASLRLKINMMHSNPVMRDPSIFRIVNYPHPIQNEQYNVWPVYDFAVSLEDGLRGITHVFRSEEFEPRNILQNHIRDLLGLKNPQIIHYSRVAIVGTPVAKRKIRPLIEDGTVTGWDDIRLSTISGLKNRGIVPETIRDLVYELQLSRSQAEIDWSIILALNRKNVDEGANRYFVAVDPVLLHIQNAPMTIAKPYLHPDYKERGIREIPTKEKVFISRSDVLKLNIGTIVRLKDLYNIKIIELGPPIVAEYLEDLDIPRQKIQWVPRENTIKVSLNKPSVLFKGEELQKDSLNIFKGLGEYNLKYLKEGQIIQLERIGFGYVSEVTRDSIDINLLE